MEKRDYYDVLGIQRSADEKEIKRAYRKLAKKYHPDTNAGNKQAEQKFKEVTEAYTILSDPEKKKLYDTYGNAAFDNEAGTGSTQRRYASSWNSEGFDFGNGGNYQEFHFEGEGYEDLFGDFFGGSFFQQHGFGNRSGNTRGRDIESEITISFEEAALGCRKRISFENGKRPFLEIQIPAGIDEGQSVRLKGKGYSGKGNLPAGDLFLKIHIAEKTGFTRQGLDVYMTQQIPYTTAVLGGEVIFHTLYGDVYVNVPAGTQSGSKIRLKGKGIVSMKDPSVRGDAYAVIQIAVPKNITPKERAVLQELQKIRERNTG